MHLDWGEAGGRTRGLPLVSMMGGADAKVAGLGFWHGDQTLETTAMGEGR